MLFNQARARRWMAECGLDAIVATSPPNTTYLSDYYCWLDPLMKTYMASPGDARERGLPAYAIATCDGEASLILTEMFAPNAADIWVNDVWTYGGAVFDRDLTPPGSRQPGHAGAASAIEALLDALHARGLSRSRIGVEREGLSPTDWETLETRLPHAELRNCSSLLDVLRAVKSEDQLRRLARATAIAEEASLTALSAARDGTSITEILEEFRRAVAQRGADFEHFAYGMDGAGIGMEPGYLLEADAVLYVDFGCTHGHCISDGGRTLALGELLPELQRRYDALCAGIEAGRAAMRPGVRASVAHAAMRDTMAGLGVTATAPQGHGLGLEVREYPIVVPDNGLCIRDDCVDIPSDLLLEPGMVVNLESAIFLPGVASLHIEQTFVVTPHGSRLLVPQDRATPFYPREVRA